ncbi:MAG: adenine phosphoribosyltransferase [Planctomycetes bacterium]|nr:adenine phosphoribosyltransferase [Planctomycetota bacterium]
MVERYIRDVPDFPKKGILFKDITPLLQSPEGLQECLDTMATSVDPRSYDIICGIESRGFIFGMGLAAKLKKGFIPIRKPGKLPWKTASQAYELEYGTDRIEIHLDAVKPGQKVLLVDDLLATGGTMEAALKLVKQIGGVPVACSFVIELGFLKGREKLQPTPVHALLKF